MDYVEVDYHCDTLGPPFELLKSYKENKDEKYYINEYYSYLKLIDIENILRFLDFKSGGKKIVLLCYEVPSDFCHRHLLADKIESLGYSIKELGFENYKRQNGKIILNSGLF